MTSSPEGEGGSKPKDDKWWHDDGGGGGGGRWKMTKLLMLIFQSSFIKPSLEICLVTKMTISISISIFFKSVDISTIDIRYRYIEQGYPSVIMSSFVIFWLTSPLPLRWWRHLWTAPYQIYIVCRTLLCDPFIGDMGGSFMANSTNLFSEITIDCFHEYWGREYYDL